MKTQSTAVIAFGALGSLGLIVWMYQAAGPEETAHPPPVSAMKSSNGPSSRPAMPAQQTADLTRGGSVGSRQDAADEANAVRLRPDQVLATVGKESIALGHLMPVGTSPNESNLTPEEFQSRLQRAIDVEVVFQAARAKGVELTEAQQTRLEKIAGGNAAALAHYKKYGLTWSSTGPEHAEFEKRLLASQMLEQNMVAQKSTLSPSPDAGVQARYEQARRELLKELHEKADITIAGSTKGP